MESPTNPAVFRRFYIYYLPPKRVCFFSPNARKALSPTDNPRPARQIATLRCIRVCAARDGEIRSDANNNLMNGAGSVNIDQNELVLFFHVVGKPSRRGLAGLAVHIDSVSNVSTPAIISSKTSDAEIASSSVYTTRELYGYVCAKRKKNYKLRLPTDLSLFLSLPIFYLSVSISISLSLYPSSISLSLCVSVLSRRVYTLEYPSIAITF